MVSGETKIDICPFSRENSWILSRGGDLRVSSQQHSTTPFGPVQARPIVYCSAGALTPDYLSDEMTLLRA